MIAYEGTTFHAGYHVCPKVEAGKIVGYAALQTGVVWFEGETQSQLYAVIDEAMADV